MAKYDISVVMPYYKDSAYVDDAVQSVLAQEGVNYEIIIVDDASHDGFLKDYVDALGESCVKLISLEVNAGLSNARNVGIQEASGDYILPLDSDDKIAPSYLSKALSVMHKDAAVGIVYCKAELFGEEQGLWELEDFSFPRFLLGNVIFATALFRKSYWQKVGGYNTNMKYGLEDFDFWLSLLELDVKVHQLPEVLFYYRRKVTSMSKTLEEDRQKLVDAHAQIFRNHKNIYEEHIEVLFEEMDSKNGIIRRQSQELQSRELVSLDQQEQFNKSEQYLVKIEQELQEREVQLEEQETQLISLKLIIQEKEQEVVQIKQSLLYFEDLAQSMRIKNRFKKILPFRQVQKTTKVLRYIKENPHLARKAFYSMREIGFKNTLLKVRAKVANKAPVVYLAPAISNTMPLPLVEEQKESRLKVAVVVHAFYIDILEDIISMINHIPGKPDLFVSVSKEANVEEIKHFLHQNAYLHVKIVQVQNRGRDVAPFLVDFAEELQAYDICCKIHGKKSLYTGSEQSNWRNHLYHNLLGSEEIVKDILNAFSQDEKLGLLFSDSLGMLPYWGYTWLTNKGAVSHALEKIGLPELASILEDDYISFPAGTMFWFRPQAIRQILDTGFRYEDFPPEPFPNDGTIAHALERLFGYVVRFNGYDFIELNQKENFYTKNSCHKNFNQLADRKFPHLLHLILDSEYVVFDIFDTLITRSIFYPDNIFRVLEQKIDKKFQIKSKFFHLRKEAEAKIRQKLAFGEDLSYHDIYTALDNVLPLDVVAYAKREEFANEQRIMHRKEETLEAFYFAKKQHKKVILLSDMYLTKEQIVHLLQGLKIDISGVEIYVSSEIGKRKDNGTVWDYLVERQVIERDKTLMIGDNEVSDCKIAADMKLKHVYHLFSEKTSFVVSPMGKDFKVAFPQVKPEEMMLLGPMLNELFSSPYSLEQTVLSFDRKLSPYDFGFNVFAPMMYLFISYLHEKHQGKKIFFLARDGYFLKELYQYFLDSKEIVPLVLPEYVYISRRAVLGAIYKDSENLKHIVYGLGDYKGLFSGLIFHRIGIDKSFLERCEIADFKIMSKKDLDRAYGLLIEHVNLVNEYSQKEFHTFTKYLDSIGFMDMDESVVVDLGFSGTIQNYLQQITKQKIYGEYFVTTNKVEKIEHSDNIFHGYFADKIAFDDCIEGNVVFRYSLIFESYLTSDEGQVLHFEEKNGVYKPCLKSSTSDIMIQQKITRGIKDYFDVLSFLEYDFFDQSSTTVKGVSTFMLEYVMQHRLIDDELASMFWIEDDFTGSGTLDILDVLKDRGI